MNNIKPPFCKDCKFCQKNWLINPFDPYEFASCYSPNNLEVDLVSGKKKKLYKFCTTLRICNNNCGPSGNWFESR